MEDEDKWERERAFDIADSLENVDHARIRSEVAVWDTFGMYGAESSAE